MPDGARTIGSANHGNRVRFHYILQGMQRGLRGARVLGFYYFAGAGQREGNMVNVIFHYPFHMETIALKHRHHGGVFRQHIGFEGIDVIFTGDRGQPFDELGADTLFLIGIQNDKRYFRGFWTGG